MNSNMNAWFESGRAGTFANVKANDVLFRSSSQANSLVLGNGLIPYGNAAVYLTSNCVGINRVPDTSLANTARVVLDIGGNVACRSSMTWCYANTPPQQTQSGSNAVRASVSGIFLNDGSTDTIRLNRQSGSVNATGSVFASNAFLGIQPTSFSNPGVLTVLGQGVFQKGIRLVVDGGTANDNGTISYDPHGDVLSIGARTTLNPAGLLVNGTIVSTGQMFAPGYRLLSDVRLKTDVSATSADGDLQEILALDVKRFELADTGAERGAARQIGVLAHELASIMPDAVSRVQDFLPDVMSRAHIDNPGHYAGPNRGRGTWIVFPQSFSPHIFRIGDRLRIRLGSSFLAADVSRLDPHDDRRICLVGSDQGNRSLRISQPGTDVYVYGTLCHDVLAVDTNHVLFKLVSAVQSIHALVQLNASR